MSTPISSPSRSTARWFTPASTRFFHASKSGIPTGTAMTGWLKTCATGVFGPSPSARTRPRRSRSVRIPGGVVRTRTDEIRSARITRAASATVAPASTHTAPRRRICATSWERSGWREATGEWVRLVLSRSASPTAKKRANVASPRSLRNSASGTR